MGIPVQQTPQSALLNLPIPKTPKLVQRQIMFVFLGTKLTIARAWKQLQALFLGQKEDIIDHGPGENSILLDTADKHEAIWEPWTRYLSQTSATPR